MGDTRIAVIAPFASCLWPLRLLYALSVPPDSKITLREGLRLWQVRTCSRLEQSRSWSRASWKRSIRAERKHRQCFVESKARIRVNPRLPDEGVPWQMSQFRDGHVPFCRCSGIFPAPTERLVASRSKESLGGERRFGNGVTALWIAWQIFESSMATIAVLQNSSELDGEVSIRFEVEAHSRRGQCGLTRWDNRDKPAGIVAFGRLVKDLQGTLMMRHKVQSAQACVLRHDGSNECD